MLLWQGAGGLRARSSPSAASPCSLPSHHPFLQDCNRCNFLIYLPPNLHSARVTKDCCEVRQGVRCGN